MVIPEGRGHARYHHGKSLLHGDPKNIFLDLISGAEIIGRFPWFITPPRSRLFLTKISLINYLTLVCL